MRDKESIENGQQSPDGSNCCQVTRRLLSGFTLRSSLCQPILPIKGRPTENNCRTNVTERSPLFLLHIFQKNLFDIQCIIYWHNKHDTMLSNSSYWLRSLLRPPNGCFSSNEHRWPWYEPTTFLFNQYPFHDVHFNNFISRVGALLFVSALVNEWVHRVLNKCIFKPSDFSSIFSLTSSLLQGKMLIIWNKRRSMMRVRETKWKF